MIVGMAIRWLVSAVVVLLAGLAGWQSAREYSPPADSGEERLVQRALEFHRASAVFDYSTMVAMYSPAYQVANAEELRRKARRWKETFELDFDEEHRADLQSTADALSREDLQIRIEGDWALVKGQHDVYVEGRPVRMSLDQTVWVRTGGDWWMYQLTNPELEAYGNPPDFARDVIFQQPYKEETLDMDAVEAQQERERQLEEQRHREQTGTGTPEGE